MSDGGNNGFIAGMRQVFEVFSREAALFRGRWPLRGAAALIALIPSLYTVIYVSAIWVLCVMFLVLQIASAGGAYPIELSPPFFRGLSPFFPLTHVVQALRAAMFGSYDGAWGRCILPALPWAAVSLGLSFLSRKRFLYVPDAAYGPALDLSFGRHAR